MAKFAIKNVLGFFPNDDIYELENQVFHNVHIWYDPSKRRAGMEEVRTSSLDLLSLHPVLARYFHLVLSHLEQNSSGVFVGQNVKKYHKRHFLYKEIASASFIQKDMALALDKSCTATWQLNI